MRAHTIPAILLSLGATEVAAQEAGATLTAGTFRLLAVDLDGARGFAGSELCLRISTVYEGSPLCNAIAALGRYDFELADGTHI